MRSFPDALRGKASWLLINRITTSFVSRSIFTLSLSIFVLANFPVLLELTGSEWVFQASLAGAIIFLAGFAYSSLMLPAEFIGVASIEQTVARIWSVRTTRLISSRLTMLENMLRRLEAESIPDLPDEYVIFARLATADYNLEASEDNARQVIHADLNLRQFDAFRARLLSLFLLTIGAFLVLLPILISFMTVLLGGV